MMAKGTYVSINLGTGDLDGALEHLQARDAEVVQEPTDHRTGFATAPSAIPPAT